MKQHIGNKSLVTTYHNVLVLQGFAMTIKKNIVSLTYKEQGDDITQD